MPAIVTTNPRAEYKFKGHTVGFHDIFTEAHPLTALEAKWANREAASRFGNILSAAIMRKCEELTKANAALPDGDASKLMDDGPTNADGTPGAKVPHTFEPGDLSTSDVQAMYDAIATNYQFGVTAARGEGFAHDPVQSIANNIAWERVKALLRKKNLAVASVKGDKKKELVDQMLAKDPAILVQAKAIFEADPANGETDDGFDLSGIDSAATPPAGSDTQPSGDTQSGDATTDAGAAGSDTVAGSEGSDTVVVGDETVPEGTVVTDPGDGSGLGQGATGSDDLTGEPSGQPGDEGDTTKPAKTKPGAGGAFA